MFFIQVKDTFHSLTVMLKSIWTVKSIQTDKTKMMHLLNKLNKIQVMILSFHKNHLHQANQILFKKKLQKKLKRKLKNSSLNQHASQMKIAMNQTQVLHIVSLTRIPLLQVRAQNMILQFSQRIIVELEAIVIINGIRRSMKTLSHQLRLTVALMTCQIKLRKKKSLIQLCMMKPTIHRL